MCLRLSWISKSVLQTGVLYINIYDNRHLLTFNETQFLTVLPETDILKIISILFLYDYIIGVIFYQGNLSTQTV